MRLFVYEYLSSGMAGDTDTLSSLNTEGWSMLRSLLSDLGLCDGVATTTMLDPRWRDESKRWPTNLELHFPSFGLRERTFDSLAAAADYTLIIAPEFDGILARLAGRVEEAGGRLLGPGLAAIQCSTDKAFLSSLWDRAGVPIPRAASLYPLVYKPRFGAGSQATFLVHNEDELAQAERRRVEEGWSGEMFRQPYVQGLPASVAFLAGPAGWHTLPAVEQRLSRDGRFHYLGGRLPLPPHLDARARKLAERAARTVEGWLGWFGVDLVLGEAEDGSSDVAIEINPRMTTSYLGLRLLARFNLAKAMLRIVAGSPPSSWEWHRDTVVFDVGDRKWVD
jgi:predicted ATP-grasp superfamily ATP-dependent carboligase